MKPVYCLSSYSVSELLKLLVITHGEKIRLEVGYPPALIVKGRAFEVEAPDLNDEAADQLLRSVATTRQRRVLREQATLEVIHTFNGSRFLISVVDAFGVFRMDLLPVTS